MATVRISTPKDRRRGSAFVEFAIGASVLTSIFAGTFQWGYTFYRYNALLAAVNAGARLASVRTYDSATTTPSTAFTTAISNMVVYGDPAGGSSPVVPGLTTSQVQVQAEFALGVPKNMVVSISGHTIPAIFGSTTLNGKPKVRYAYQGIYSPLAH
jgi:Flp pilus assembly protein TadG